MYIKQEWNSPIIEEFGALEECDLDMKLRQISPKDDVKFGSVNEQ